MSTWPVHPCGSSLFPTPSPIQHTSCTDPGCHDLDGVKELVSDSLTALGLFTLTSPPPTHLSSLSFHPLLNMYTLTYPAYNSRNPCMYKLCVTLGWVPAHLPSRNLNRRPQVSVTHFRFGFALQPSISTLQPSTVNSQLILQLPDT